MDKTSVDQLISGECEDSQAVQYLIEELRKSSFLEKTNVPDQMSLEEITPFDEEFDELDLNNTSWMVNQTFQDEVDYQLRTDFLIHELPVISEPLFESPEITLTQNPNHFQPESESNGNKDSRITSVEKRLTTEITRADTPKPQSEPDVQSSLPSSSGALPSYVSNTKHPTKLMFEDDRRKAEKRLKVKADFAKIETEIKLRESKHLESTAKSPSYWQKDIRKKWTSDWLEKLKVPEVIPKPRMTSQRQKPKSRARKRSKEGKKKKNLNYRHNLKTKDELRTTNFRCKTKRLKNRTTKLMAKALEMGKEASKRAVHLAETAKGSFTSQNQSIEIRHESIQERLEQRETQDRALKTADHYNAYKYLSNHPNEGLSYRDVKSVGRDKAKDLAIKLYFEKNLKKLP